MTEFGVNLRIGKREVYRWENQGRKARRKMLKTAHDWFQKNTANDDPVDNDPTEPPASSSLLSKWNSYTSSISSEDGSSSSLKLDLESAVRSANEKFTGVFSVYEFAQILNV